MKTDGAEESVVVCFLLLREKPGLGVTGKERREQEYKPRSLAGEGSHQGCEEYHARSTCELGRDLMANKAGAETKARQASSFTMHSPEPEQNTPTQ